MPHGKPRRIKPKVIGGMARTTRGIVVQTRTGIKLRSPKGLK